MSPRTKRVHFGENATALCAIVFVVHHLERLRPHLLAPSEAHSIYESLADGIRCRRSVGHEFCERALGAFVRSKVPNCHLDIVVHFV